MHACMYLHRSHTFGRSDHKSTFWCFHNKCLIFVLLHKQVRHSFNIYRLRKQGIGDSMIGMVGFLEGDKIFFKMYYYYNIVKVVIYTKRFLRK